MSPAEKGCLIEAIKRVRGQQPGLTNEPTLRTALEDLHLEDRLKCNSSNASIWIGKAFPKSFQNGEAVDDMPPEQAIAHYERKIQEELKKIDARRNLKMQEIQHMDNLLSKYKVPRQ